MRVLKFVVEGQNIYKDKNCDFENIVRGSNNWLQLEFTFDREWNDTNRVISLQNLDGEETNVIIKDKCVLKENVTKDSVFTFCIYGKRNNQKIKTNRMIVNQI